MESGETNDNNRVEAGQTVKKQNKNSKIIILIITLMVIVLFSVIKFNNQFKSIELEKETNQLENLQLFESNMQNSLENSILNKYDKTYLNQIQQLNQEIISLRANQLPHLGDKIYLDATGAGLYTKQQIQKNYDFLTKNLLCNTHSINSCSEDTQRMINKIKLQILQFLGLQNDSINSVVFTKSTTHSLQIINDIIPINQQKSKIVLARHSHNSVIGLRNRFEKKNQIILDANFYKKQFQTQNYDLKEIIERNTKNNYFKENDTYNVFAIPAKDNFVGVNYDLSVINYLNKNDDVESILNKEKQLNNHVLTILDAAAYLQTQQLNLSNVHPHFVVFSLYKIFGTPTSVGCLIIRNDVISVLKKQYYGGGSTVVVDVDSGFAGFKKSAEKFEDGTLDYLGISQIESGLQLIKQLQLYNIDKLTGFLTNYLYSFLSNYKINGKKVFEIYSDKDNLHNIVAFNAFDKEHEYFSTFMVTSQLSDANVIIRAGSLCNPGAAQYYCQYDNQLVQQLYKEKQSCADKVDIWEGKCLGALRVSFGYWSTIQDVQYFLKELIEIVKQ